MKAILISALVTLFCISTAYPQKSYKINFQMVSPSLADTATVYITGNVPPLGNWSPAKVAMKYIGNHTWTNTIKLPHPYNYLEYKYTLGSWDREATDNKAQPLQNFGLKVTQDTTVRNEIQHWLKKESHTFKGGVTGKTEIHKAVSGENLLKRDLIVWLPPGYESGTKQYPVLYMHDGQNIFDPSTSSFGTDWQIDETADSLIRTGAIEPVIIVGINNTPDRSEEYTPGKKGSAYMDFVVNTVKPFIDQTYRTKKEREHTFTGGSSAGGIMSFMLAWEYPAIFSKAICMSPAFKIQHIDFVKDVRSYQGEKKRLYFYIDNGGLELEERLQPGIDEMLIALKEKGYVEGKDFIWIKDATAKHNEAAWAKRIPVALKAILPPKN